jgi:galactitol PTS system EIIA component
MIRSDFVRLQLQASSAEEVIRELGDAFYRHQIVKESYIEAVLEREREYPTGLPGKDLFIAIPHTDSSHVNEPGISIATLATPVSFGLMSDPEQKVDVSLVFLLAVADPHKHLAMLQKLMGLLSQPTLLQKLQEASSVDEVVESLQAVFA